MTIIKDIAKELGKEGHLYQREWKNFGYNRTELLELARPHCQWALMMDADDFAEGVIPPLDKNVQAYTVCIKHHSIVHYRPHLFNSDHIWKYKGALHEYAYLEGMKSLEKLDSSFCIQARCEGARSKDPQKFLNDALTLKKELDTTDDMGRTLFYCAQSYRDAGMKGEALKYYKKRAEFNGWYEENYISCLNIIRLTDTLEEKLVWAWKGVRFNIKRKEIPFEIISFCRKKNIWSEEVYAMGHLYKNAKCTGVLFQEPLAYGWVYYNELGIVAFYLGRKYEAKLLFLLAKQECPEDQREYVDKNMGFCE